MWSTKQTVNLQAQVKAPQGFNPEKMEIVKNGTCSYFYARVDVKRPWVSKDQVQGDQGCQGYRAHQGNQARQGGQAHQEAPQRYPARQRNQAR